MRAGWCMIVLLCLGAAAAAAPAAGRQAGEAAVGPEPYLGLGHSRPITAAAWSPDSKTLATGSSDGRVVFWDVASRRPRATLSGYTVGLSHSPAISWSPDGKWVAVHNGATAGVWEVRTGKTRARLTGFVAPLTHLFWSRDGKTLIGFDNHRVSTWVPAARWGWPRLQDNVVLFDPHTGARIARLPISAGVAIEGRPLSPDGTLLADYSEQHDSRLTLWDTATWTRRFILDARPEVAASVAWSADSRTLASFTGKDVVLWNAATGRRLATLSPGRDEERISSVAWSPDGRYLATAAERTDAAETRITLWDPVTATPRRRLRGRWGLERLTWGPHGNVLAAHGRAGMALWNLSSGERGTVLTGANRPAAWSPDGKLLVTDEPGNSAVLWSVPTGRRIGVFASHATAIAALAWAPNGKAIAAGSATDRPGGVVPDTATAHVALWGARTGAVLRVLPGLPGSVSDLAWRPDSTAIAASAGRYGIVPNLHVWSWLRSAVVLWRTDRDGERTPLIGACPPAAWTPDGTTLIARGSAANVQLWDGTRGVLRSTLPIDSGWGLALSPDGKRLVEPGGPAGRSGWSIWDLATQQVVARLPRPTTRDSSLAWSPDSRTIAISAGDGLVTLRDAQTGARRRTLTLRTRSSPWGTAELAWRPDGQLLACGLPREGIVKLWRPESGQLSAILTGPSPGTFPLRWSPDGHTLACGYHNQTIVLWDAATRRRRALLGGHTGAITALAWSPDSRTVATGSADGSVRLWSAASGRERAAFYALDQGQEWLTVTPQGYFMASPRGADVIQWRQGARLWPLTRFRRRFEQPERVRRALAGHEMGESRMGGREQ